MKITLGIPCTGTVTVQTAISLISIVGNAEWQTHTHFQSGCYVHDNRERIVKAAKEAGSDYLFFVDTDMYLADNTLKQLLAHKKEIIGVNYNQREFPLRSTVKFADENDNILEVPDLPRELFTCYAVGTGCMLIDMKVFEKIEPPYFSFDVYGGEIMGEDVWFCRQAKRAGINVWCDPTINVSHIGVYAY